MQDSNKESVATRESGYVLIAILTVLFLMVGIGLTLAKVVMNHHSAKSAKAGYIQAGYIALGGLEWAKNQINQGNDPTVTQLNFDRGYLSITTEPEASKVHATGIVGDSKVTYTITTPMSGNSVGIDLSKTKRAGNQIKFIDFSANTSQVDSPILDKLQVVWNPVGDIKLIEVKCDTNTLYSSAGVGSGTLVDLTNYTISSGGGTSTCQIKCSDPIPMGTKFDFTWFFKDSSKVTFTIIANN